MDPTHPLDEEQTRVERLGIGARSGLPPQALRASVESAVTHVIKELFAYAQFDALDLDPCEDGCVAICARFRAPAVRSEAIAHGRAGRTTIATLLEDAISGILRVRYGSAWLEDIRVDRLGTEIVCAFIAHTAKHDGCL